MTEHDAKASVERLQVGANHYKEAATRLSVRLEAFERWLSTLPGKLDCGLPIHSDEDGDELHVWFHREGKSWLLSCGWLRLRRGDEGVQEWIPVASAPVETKLLVIRSASSILQGIELAQASSSARIDAANAEFDTFANAMGFGPNPKREGA